jgi:hypothetical protein
MIQEARKERKHREKTVILLDGALLVSGVMGAASGMSLS